MVSVTHAAHDIEITAESLQEDLARLEVQKQALERELAAVVAHLGSVQRALGALQTVMREAGGRPPAAIAGPAPAAPQAQVPSPVPADAAATAAPAPKAHRPAPGAAATAPGGTADVEADADADADGQKNYGRLTEQILDYLAGVGNADVRARDVATALGRDTDNGSINAVRSTLDRLVGTSRIRRTGRGLYRAKKS